MSPIPRFESPNSEHSDDGPIGLDAAPPHPHLGPKSMLKGPPRGGVRQLGDSPGHTPPHDGGHPPSRYEGPGHMGASRPHPPGWYEDSSRFEEPHHRGPGRFDGGGPPHHNMPERFEGHRECDGPPMSHGPIRGGDAMGRFDGPPQGSGRFDGPPGQQPPARFGPGHFEGPMQRFEHPRRFDDSMAPRPGPMGFQQRPLPFEGQPNQMGPMRFDGPSRFEGPGQPAPAYDIPNVPHQGGPHFEGQQGPQRFGPQHNLQPPMRQMAPPIYDNPMGPQQNFNMASQHFPEPINPQFPTGSLAFPAQAGNFNVQPAPPFGQPGPAPYYNPSAPAVGMQPVSDSCPSGDQVRDHLT